MDSKKKTVLPVNPRENVNLFSFLTFWYTLPLFSVTHKKDPITEGDLFQPLKEHASVQLGDELTKAWENNLKKSAEKNKKPALWKSIFSTFKWPLLRLGLALFTIEFGIKMIQPFVLSRLISHYSGDENLNTAYVYAGAVIVTNLLVVMGVHPFMLGQMHLGMKLRIASCSLVYRKALRLSKPALAKNTAGQTANLLSNDVGRFDQSALFIHYLWVGPLETVIITILLYFEIGISAICGVSIVIAGAILQQRLGKRMGGLRLRTARRTDSRVRLTNEIIQGIQVIKMYAWEKPFGKLIEELRKKEIKVIRRTTYIRGVLLSFIMFSTRTSIFISLVVYAVLGNFVSAEKAFIVTAYFNILRQTMTVFFPQGCASLNETFVSIKRIEDFLLSAEKDDIPIAVQKIKDEELKKTVEMKNDDSVRGLIVNDAPSFRLDENVGLELSNLEASWAMCPTTLTLQNINMSVARGTLVAVIGPVGSGKSSIIQAILGELPIFNGTIAHDRRLSYAAQEPWLFSSTIRQNILFGKKMDKARYKRVVRICALENDFAMFGNGDRTIVGERGQSLSGGQKARISLARAVYREASVYLLDDPLSAVDAHVGTHLFNECIRSFLHDKVVVLVTHQLHFLQHADHIVIMKDGCIQQAGSFEELQASGISFAKMLSRDVKDAEKEKADAVKATALKRTNSTQSSISSTSTVEDNRPDLMNVNEEVKQGSIGAKLYLQYIKAGGGICPAISVAIFFIAAQLLASAGDYFLSYWVNKQRDDTYTVAPANDTVAVDDSQHTDIYIFTGITVATIVVTLFRSFLFVNFTLQAAYSLHKWIFNGLSHAMMHFFNTNPSGRILNRFSKDLGVIDEILPMTMIDVMQIFLSLFGIIIVLGISNYYFLIPALIIGVIFFFVRRYYLHTSRQIKRLEGTTRSPIYSHVNASLDGIDTIRVFGAQDALIAEFDNYQDANSSTFFAFICVSRAFGFVLDMFCVLFIAIVTMTFFLLPDATAGQVGLAITQAMGLTGMVQWGFRQSAELENNMTCVERVMEYESLASEEDTQKQQKALESKDQVQVVRPVPSTWPESGHVKFVNLNLKYFPADEADWILKNLNIDIQAMHKIGICGRTGAGKSSIINALFRLSFIRGSIMIDNVDTSDVSLYELRSKIAIIPQEPVLFSGTMRFNLDPFDEYSDDRLWSVLEQVQLKTVVASFAGGLNAAIAEHGSNFSVGQRQLVCLARAILRNTKILILDEATANVDPQTDQLIQESIRKQFKQCTVLTIAHRLNTVMDSDMVLVMDSGRCAQFGRPYDLMKQGSGKFHDMVMEGGRAHFQQMLTVAGEAAGEDVAGYNAAAEDAAEAEDVVDAEASGKAAGERPPHED